MFETAIGLEQIKTAKQLKSQKSVSQLLWILGVLGLTAVLAYPMVVDGPSWSDLAWIIFWVCFSAIVIEPRRGIYIILFMTLVGDKSVSWWFPFTKNFSSEESLLFYSNSFSFTPLEIFIALIAVVWVARGVIRRDFSLKTGPLFWPSLIFTGLMGYGLIYGLLSGGNTNIALWESRAIFYIFAMLVLTSNLIREKEHVQLLFWMIILALFVEGLIGSYTLIFEYDFRISDIETLFDHSASIHANVYLLFLAAAFLFKKVSGTKKVVLLLLVAPVALTYLASQRRAAFLSLGIALVLLFVFLFRERRHLFRYIAPPLTVLAIAYIGVFWNSNSTLALPAQAVKSVVAPDFSNEKDRSSNLYRITENLNAEFTIQQRPLTGVGFGNKFFILYPLPDISFFEWWEYITHNSIIWIWMKTGFFGFASMIFLVGLSILVGMRALLPLPQSDLRLIGIVMLLYLIMHFTFAYVDISWTDQSMVLVGTAMGLLNVFNEIAAKPDIVATPRWPWQIKMPAGKPRPVNSYSRTN